MAKPAEAQDQRTSVVTMARPAEAQDQRSSVVTMAGLRPAPCGLRSALVTMVLAALTACATLAGAAGATCGAASDCQDSMQCLYAIGAGCDAQGHCGVAASECIPDASNLVLCGCPGAVTDLSCISSSAELTQPTATGLACVLDGGGDE
ncbi:MAG: hypothetical protein ABSC94_08540 [Polyangiaceae bacterium]|jgi:hypothetical protein